MSSRRHLMPALLLAALLAAGCQGPPGSSARAGTAGPQRASDRARLSNTDACAMRLHDIAGALLFYYATHHALPERLDELGRLPGFENIGEFACPVSRQPYIYNPTGILNPDGQSRLVVYDAAPSHSGLRWAVSIIEPSDNAPLIAKVIAVPESMFSPAATRPTP
jgi:hypothetical protein